VERVLSVLDTNNSGKIDFTEFMVAAFEKEKLIRDECLLQAFDFFDVVTVVVTQDNTGYLDIH
jgi:Ca2+-binding EF-hand superfamily protein